MHGVVSGDDRPARGPARQAACDRDGEACVLDEIGRSDFERLRARARRQRWFAGAEQVTLCAIDLLFLDGQNVKGWPLGERKAVLH